MSTIIEPGAADARGTAWAVRCLARAAQVALVLGAWAAILLAMPFLGRPGRQVAIVGEPNAAARAVLAAGGRIVEVRRGAVLARSDAPGFVARLYAAGAGPVIEGRIAAGCFAPRAAKAGA